MKDSKDTHKNAHVLSHPYDMAFKAGLQEGSSKLIVPLINAMFHLKIPLDKHMLIYRLNSQQPHLN